jgi:signal transduction histidine kinase
MKNLFYLFQFNAMKKESKEKLQQDNKSLSRKLEKKTALLKTMKYNLKIEAALERVRTVVLGMSGSDDLLAICKSIYRELLVLGFKQIRNAQIAIRNDAMQSYTIWEYSDFFSARIDHAPFKGSPVILDLYNKLIKSNHSMYQKLYTGKKLENWKTWRKSIGAKSDKRIDKAEAIGFYLYSFNKGHLGLSTFSAISNEQLNTLKRFKQVFELSYRKYVDVTRAEEQTREAQIELGLERVRTKAMAMQKSEDLGGAIAIVFEELDKLKLDIIRVGIGIINKEKRTADLWTATKSDDNSVMQVVGDESMDLHPLLKGVFEAWLKQEDFNYVLQGSDLNDYYKALTGANFKLPESQSFVSGHGELTHHHFNALFPAGGLFAFRETPFTDEAKQVMKRFANVFNLTYTRFNDLKLAEHQAEQANLDLIKLHAEKKRAEEALKELKDTQTQLIQSEKMASLGELTAGIAHEIQNPLNFVNNFSEVSNELVDEMNAEMEKGDLAEAKAIASDIQQNLQKIAQHGKRADAIVKSMLMHSRSSSGVKEPTDINALTDEYLRLAYHGLRAKEMSFNATMKTDYDHSIGSMDIISQDIGRVILNLIGNAFYAVSEKKKLQIEGYEPTVYVSTKHAKDHIEISIVDNGTGIPEKLLDKIFQPFFTTKPTGQGTGLGLSLSYDIVKAAGGELKVETREGEGTRFTIILPA